MNMMYHARGSGSEVLSEFVIKLDVIQFHGMRYDSRTEVLGKDKHILEVMGHTYTYTYTYSALGLVWSVASMPWQGVLR